MSTNVLSQKAVLAGLNISRWTARKLDKRVTREVNESHNADAAAGRYTKRLIAAKSLAEIDAAVTAARSYHYDHTQPWFDQGARILPSKLYLDYAEAMQGLRRKFERAADAFADAYPSFVDQAKIDLNGLFNESDYPVASQIRRKFDFDVAILPCPDTSDDFRIALGDVQAREIRRDVEARMDKALEGAMKGAASRVLEVVGHMAERLAVYTPGSDGVKASNTFRDSLVENVREIAKLLPAFNLSDDGQLAAITQLIETKLCVHDADELRENDAVRLQVKEQAELILTAVSDFIA